MPGAFSLEQEGPMEVNNKERNTGKSETIYAGEAAQGIMEKSKYFGRLGNYE